MTTTTTPTPLGLGHVLQTPLNLGAILDLARQPGTHGRTVAAYIERWAAEAGGAKDALLTAPAADLGGLITGDLESPDWCEGCKTPLPNWVESVKDDWPLKWCVSCAVVDQQANPQNWREVMADRAAEVFGHDA